MVTTTILLIDDDRSLCELTGQYLQEIGGFRVVTCFDGVTGYDTAIRLIPDLIVLDLLLPGLGGNEVCRRIRVNQATRDIPIIMLSACGEEIDRVVGFEVGADDYVTKPFSLKELLLRIQVVIRRITAVPAVKMPDSPIFSLDHNHRQVEVDGVTVKLTRIEFELLSTLAEQAGKVVGRDELLRKVWGYRVEGTSRTTDVHITRLRSKLGEAGNLIKTVSGFGYMLAERRDASPLAGVASLSSGRYHRAIVPGSHPVTRLR